MGQSSSQLLQRQVVELKLMSGRLEREAGVDERGLGSLERKIVDAVQRRDQATANIYARNLVQVRQAVATKRATGARMHALGIRLERTLLAERLATDMTTSVFSGNARKQHRSLFEALTRFCALVAENLGTVVDEVLHPDELGKTMHKLDIIFGMLDKQTGAMESHLDRVLVTRDNQIDANAIVEEIMDKHGLALATTLEAAPDSTVVSMDELELRLQALRDNA